MIENTKIIVAFMFILYFASIPFYRHGRRERRLRTGASAFRIRPKAPVVKPRLLVAGAGKTRRSSNRLFKDDDPLARAAPAFGFPFFEREFYLLIV
jgi:hypothetical protein